MLRKILILGAAAAALGLLLAVPTPAPVDAATPAPAPAAAPAPDAKADIKALNRKVEEAVEEGLKYLKRTQHPDGHWEAQGGQYPTSMTALAAMCFLMEGSTLREGKYSDQIEKAVRWFIGDWDDDNSKPRQTEAGCLGNLNNPTESTRYMYGHGFGTLFLASVYGEEEKGKQRKRLEQVLKKCVEFIAKAQTEKDHPIGQGKTVKIGGWGYVSAADSGQGRGGFDEGSVTITQLQALRACKNAGIPVPKETIDRALAYLEACTTPDGGVIYSYAGSQGNAARGQERPPITAAAVACSFSAGQYKSELAKRWIRFCKDKIPIASGRLAHDEYQSYYFAQAVYVLGDDRYADMFDPQRKDPRGWLTWSRYKYGHEELDPKYPNGGMYRYLLDAQDRSGGQMNGAWTSGYIGPVFATSVNLTILQLEKGMVPIYQR